MAGAPLFWKKPCSSFSVQKDGSKLLGITADQLQTIGLRAFEVWGNANCPGGGHPNFKEEAYPQVDCTEVDYKKTARNQNLWVFRDENAFDDPNVVALTSVIFEPNSGEIYDVDMEFNSFRYAFDPGTGVGDYELQAVVQHETGHVLGLAHSDVADSSMSTSYDARIDMSSLSPDDEAGVCAVHPPVAKMDSQCDAEPRHGFSTLCDEPIDQQGCSCTVTDKARNRHSLALLYVALGLLLIRRKSVRNDERC
jgi:MYXO-CTERM domain-containing protein